ncbi:hypothetical protein DSO57_1038061 [Entomophthora muscae]|uniref:Uncharacterized protein n=1 Tax=Entomophthora muscae TaxID=34485 RepID=A0ACC2UJE1_9FUNG|nr:hypothetical protein DSO57_1038061 [Entomophthora muscae]
MQDELIQEKAAAITIIQGLQACMDKLSQPSAGDCPSKDLRDLNLLPAIRRGWQEPSRTCSGITLILPVAMGPSLGPKSYAQVLVGLAGPGKTKFSCPELPVQAHSPLSNLGSPIGDPFFNQVLWVQESLSNQSKNGDQIGKNPKTPEAKPAKINDQPSQDGPSKSQITVPENLKNDHEAANQTAKPEMPSLVTQIAPEECPEAPA